MNGSRTAGLKSLLAVATTALLAFAFAAPGVAKDRSSRALGPVPPGTALTDLPGNSVGRAIAFQADGKILVGGETGKRRTNFALVRYRTNGKLDRGFHQVTRSPGAVSSISDVAVQPDGKIVVVGDIAPKVKRPQFDFAVARYLPGGRLDRSFGRRGIARADFGSSDSATSVALARDGKIVVAGNTSRGNRLVDFAVARFSAEGVLDPSFGSQGKAAVSFAGRSLLFDVFLLANGGVQVAGQSGVAGESDVALARFTNAGASDPAFGDAGKLLVSSAPSSQSAPFSQPRPQDTTVAFSETGELTAASRGQSTGPDLEFPLDAAQVRLDGSLDPTYGSGGRARVAGVGFFLSEVVIGSDGSATVLEIGSEGRKRSGPALTRVSASGVLDTTFGKGGHALSRFRGAQELSSDVAIAPDGSTFVTGAYSRTRLITAKGEALFLSKFGALGRLRGGFG